MDSKQALEIFEKEKEKNIFTLLNSKEELRNWAFVYFDFLLPSGVVFPDSTHGPLESAWRIYEIFKTGESADIPQVCMLASRDSGKTVIAAILEVLCMVHFRVSIGHMAAIKSQSLKALSYINGFIRKIKPYLIKNNWKSNSDSKTLISWTTEDGQEIYIKVIIATLSGANSEHLPILFVDEVELADAAAVDEAKMIPTDFKNYSSLTIYLSTRKFSGGLMEKILKETEDMGCEILRWNIIDIAKKISDLESLKHLPKITKYISKELPLQNITEEEYKKLNETTKENFESFEAYAGIANHPLLPVMKNYLVDRDHGDDGIFSKSLKSVRNSFSKLPDEMANAQLLCNKPGSSGLVYPKFDSSANTLTVDEAYERLFGEEKTMTFDLLIQHMKSLGVTFYGGADWGFTDLTSLIVIAVLANGDVWLMDCFTSPGLEIDDILKEAIPLHEYYGIGAWYCDIAYPAYLKAFNRKGMKAPTFDKDVEAGIIALQRKICNSTNKRSFYIIKTKNNEQIEDAFPKYRWKLDAKGDPTNKPEHAKKIADIMDSIRYPFQILFSEKNKVNFAFAGPGEKKPSNNNELMRREIEIRTEGTVKPREPGTVQNTRGVKFLF